MNLECVQTSMLLVVVVLCDEKANTWGVKSSFNKLISCLAKHALCSNTLIGRSEMSENRATYYLRRSSLYALLEEWRDGILCLVIVTSAECIPDRPPRYLLIDLGWFIAW
jgi:hypothetical protein